MSLRWKIAVALAVLASSATVLVGVASYGSTRARLFDEVDRSLSDVDRFVNDRQLGRGALPERGPLSGLVAQVIGPDGQVRQSTFPGDAIAAAGADDVIGRPRATSFSTVRLDDADYRVRSVGLPRGAVQVARSLEETNRVLGALRTRLLLLVVVMAGVAILAGLWIAGRVTASLRRLTAAVEHVEETGRLDVAVGESGEDEVGRLSGSFDRMVAALARSRGEQQRLVQDAGHELRTPLTSLRTNIDSLRRYPDLSSDERDSIVADLHAEAEELTELVNEIVAVASGDALDEPTSQIDVLVVADDAAERFRRRTERTITVTGPSDGSVLAIAQPAAVARAISCMIDNACKFDGSHSSIDVTVSASSGEVNLTVADRGPGVPEDQLEAIFDRFHRADEARTMPGSGLGLAIVREVARRQGGDATAARRDGGGLAVTLRLPQPDRSVCV